ncbi:unnamed protein product [Coregonus sp. 'balchen']|nr:unnamed protein product [Coregonus sp. 'balchen']
MEEPLVFACGDFVDRSVQTAWEDNDTEVDSAFGDWSSAKSDTVERSSSLSSPWSSPMEMNISNLSTKMRLENGDVKKPCVVFQECFQILGESEKANCTLLAPSSCHGDTPAFLYQVSQQWLTQCSIWLQPQHHKKALALNYGEG